MNRSNKSIKNKNNSKNNEQNVCIKWKSNDFYIRFYI